MADALEQRTDEILEANARDMEAGEEAGLHAGLLDRLKLDEARLAGDRPRRARDRRAARPGGRDDRGPPARERARRAARARAARGRRRGLRGAPERDDRLLGALPQVGQRDRAARLVDGGALERRARAGGRRSPRARPACPTGAISIVTGGDRDELRQIATQDGVVDLVIPRGGEGLKAALKEHATVPVIYAAGGNGHVFVDASADLDDAVAITVNAKVQRPSTCNAAETLLVHADIAAEFLPRALRELRESGVELRVDGRTRALAGELADSLVDATEEDWATEYHALILAVKVVDSVEEAIEHVNRYGSGHSEAIVTGSTMSAQAFTGGVDAAAVYVNASTRFTDGGVFGMGAEIGNSTQKLHARGPIGLRELTTYKFVVEGSGQVRE